MTNTQKRTRLDNEEGHKKIRYQRRIQEEKEAQRQLREEFYKLLKEEQDDDSIPEIP